MRLLLVLAVVLCACVLMLVADRAIKAIKRGRRRRGVNERLAAVAAVVDERERKRRAASDARDALTSVMPTIHEHETRRVE